MRAEKYIVLLGDGMPDQGESTPLMEAGTPNLDAMAREGTVGSAKTTPDGFEPGSDVTNMGIIGYAPEVYYTGRSPLEAAAMGVELGPNDIAFRCNLVTLLPVAGGIVMKDFSAGHIETDEAREIIETLNEKLGDDEISFHAGVSYRHLMVWKNGEGNQTLVPPHDISDDEIRESMPTGDGAKKIISLMNEAQMLLKNHPVNLKRKAAGKLEANSIWLWGQGAKPTLSSLKELSGVSGAMITAVDLMRGLATCAGMKIIEVDGATGWIDTNYEGKAAAAIEALNEVDYVFVHVESPDESGHAGSREYKVQSITDFDKKVVGPIWEAVKNAEYNARIIALSDHATPVELKTHTLEPVPFVIWPKIDDVTADSFDERIVGNNNKFDSAVALNNYFIEGQR